MKLNETRKIKVRIAGKIIPGNVTKTKNHYVIEFSVEDFVSCFLFEVVLS